MPTIKKKPYVSKKQKEQQIVTLANKISGFMTANKKIINISLSALAAVLILAAGFSLKRSMDEQKAGPLLASAYEWYSPATGSNPDYARALDLFRDVQKKYPSTMSGAIAGYYAGNALMNLGRNEEALKEYQAFVQEYTNDEFLLGLVYKRMGYLYSRLGKEADAIKAFEQSEKALGPGIATMELAKLYERTGNPVEAQKKYKIIADKLKGTSLAAEAMAKARIPQGTIMPAPAKAP